MSLFPSAIEEEIAKARLSSTSLWILGPGADQTVRAMKKGTRLKKMGEAILLLAHSYRQPMIKAGIVGVVTFHVYGDLKPNTKNSHIVAARISDYFIENNILVPFIP